MIEFGLVEDTTMFDSIQCVKFATSLFEMIYEM